MYKNAGIKSKEEAAQRLINGEVFYFGVFNSEIRFDASVMQPFRCRDQELVAGWDTFAAWQVKVDWRDNIGDGVLCWVWGRAEEKRRTRVIKAYRNGLYITDTDIPWGHAEPLTLEEAKKFILGARDADLNP